MGNTHCCNNQMQKDIEGADSINTLVKFLESIKPEITDKIQHYEKEDEKNQHDANNLTQTETFFYKVQCLIFEGKAEENSNKASLLKDYLSFYDKFIQKLKDKKDVDLDNAKDIANELYCYFSKENYTEAKNKKLSEKINGVKGLISIDL